MRTSKYKSLFGKKFNHFTVIGVKRGLVCQCECGQVRIMSADHLISGKQKSCGCLKVTYGCSGSEKDPLFVTWRGIIRRCLKKDCKDFPSYGGRGITICERWRSAANFSSDMGERPSEGHSVDRKDNEGHYSCGKCQECKQNNWPMNCRWATASEQALNSRRTIHLTYQGVTKPLMIWAKEIGMKRATLVSRIRAGWTVERALTLVSAKRLPHTSHTLSTHSL